MDNTKYKWYKDGIPIEGETSNTYTIKQIDLKLLYGDDSDDEFIITHEEVNIHEMVDQFYDMLSKDELDQLEKVSLDKAQLMLDISK